MSVNISLNLALECWDGVTKILTSSFKELPMGLSPPWNGTAGPSLFTPWFRVRCVRNPLTPPMPTWYHHCGIFCLILRRSTELHQTDWNKPLLLPVSSHRNWLAPRTFPGLHWDIVLWSQLRLLFLLCQQFSTCIIWSQPSKHFYCWEDIKWLCLRWLQIQMNAQFASGNLSASFSTSGCWAARSTAPGTIWKKTERFQSMMIKAMQGLKKIYRVITHPKPSEKASKEHFKPTW